MYKTIVVLLVVFQYVISKDLDENAERRSSNVRTIHFNYIPPGPTDVYTHQIANRLITGPTGFHMAIPTNFYPMPQISNAYVNHYPSPAQLAILNDRRSKTQFGFIFSSPHDVQFHDQSQTNDMKVVKTHIHVETLKGDFKDFIKTDDNHVYPPPPPYVPKVLPQGQPAGITDAGHVDSMQPLADPARGDVTTEAKPAATTLTSSSRPLLDGGSEDVQYDIDTRKDNE